MQGCGAVPLRVLNDRPIFWCRFDEVEGGGKNLALTNGIVCSSERPTHRVVHDQCSWQLELMCPVFERADHDGDRRNSRVLDRCCNVSDRHMAHRSDGNKEHHIDVLPLDPLDPLL